MKKYLLVLMIFLISCGVSIGKEFTIYIVTGAKTDIDIKCSDLKSIYLKEKIFIKHVRVIPVNLPSDNFLRKIFNKYVLNMTQEELNIYWNEKYYEGVVPPIVLKSQKAVKKFLQNVEGSIGYLTKDYLDKSLKIKCILKVNVNEKDFNSR